MNKNKKIIGILIIVLIIVIGIVATYKLIENSIANRENFKFNVENISSTPVDTINNEQNKERGVKWEEISNNGVDEEMLFQNIDTNTLQKIATELQTLCDEIAEKQKEEPDSVLRGEWVHDIIDSPRYRKVIEMGNDAMKPLYWIIYKSSNQGMYEYICALALAELSEFNFDEDGDGRQSWATSKEFLTEFNKKIINN